MVYMKDAMETPNRPEESENEAGYQAMLLTLDWKEGRKCQSTSGNRSRKVTHTKSQSTLQ